MQFLKKLDLPDSCKIFRNFPYISDSEKGTNEPPILIACWNNFLQFAFASRPRYRRAVRQHWSVFSRSAREFVIITFSCGLEIINQCLTAEQPWEKMHIFALGPVAWHIPPVPHTIIQGTHDYYSGWFFRNPHVTLANTGHMDYLKNDRVPQLINQYLCGNILNS